MTSDYLNDLYNESSAKASAIARQLALAGIAVVWLFSGASATSGELRFPGLLLPAGLLLVTSLAFDLLHAVYRAFAFGIYAFAKRHEEPPTDVDLPAFINYPSLVLFVGKLVAVVAAYVLLGLYLAERVTT
jgi:hypothetical protein